MKRIVILLSTMNSLSLATNSQMRQHNRESIEDNYYQDKSIIQE